MGFSRRSIASAALSTDERRFEKTTPFRLMAQFKNPCHLKKNRFWPWSIYIYYIYIYYIPTSPSPISWEFASSLELFSKVCATVFWVFLRRPRLQTPHHGGVHRVSGQDPRRDDWARCGAGHLWGIANHLTSSSIYNSSLPCRTYT